MEASFPNQDNSRTGAANDGTPFVLPVQLAPSEDLTFRARLADIPCPSLPFDDDPQFDALFDTVARVLHRRHTNHVLLVGERGVGKTTLLAELARRAVVGRIPFLSRRRFIQVDCRFVAPDESRQRLAAILGHVAASPELIICLDGFASLLRREGGGSNKTILLSILSRVACQVIGLLTPREFEELIADDQDVLEFFARIDAEEPSLATAHKLLGHFAQGLEQRFRLAITPEAVQQAVHLSANYILNDHLPAKALKLLVRVCEDIAYERTHSPSPRPCITANDIVRMVAETTFVPEETLRGIAERSDYEHSLRELIIGQDHAVREIAIELGLIKAGMTDPSKPASVMLFLGQTGTGKTETAKALARFYSRSKRLKTYTLGNCVESHSVATIIGVPPGYVGNDQGGRLINDLNSDPYCVFLLDEADKAHPDVLQPFLNLFDEGWVSDQRGVRGFANKSIFILTSNVGQKMIADLFQQGATTEEIAARMKEALSQIRHSKSDRPVFSPEFLARIKRIIVFRPLDKEAMHGIARKLLAELHTAWLTKRSKNLEIPDALAAYIGEQAFVLNERAKGREGGRIVRKLIADHLESAVQRAITAQPQEYAACGIVKVHCTPPPDDASDSAAVPTMRVEFCSVPS